MSSVHEGKKPIDGKKSFKCDICRASYNHEDELIGHMISIHDGKKSFKCDNLNSGNKAESKNTKESINLAAATSELSQSNSDVEIHGFNSDTEVDSRPVHEGKKPYRCDDCEVSFSSQKMLLDHNLSVHKKKKPYNCETCNYNFSTKSHLYKHIAAIHQGKKSNDGALNLKKRKASGNLDGEKESNLRRIACSLCDKNFARNQNLVYHVATVHEEEKLIKSGIVA